MCVCVCVCVCVSLSLFLCRSVTLLLARSLAPALLLPLSLSLSLSRFLSISLIICLMQANTSQHSRRHPVCTALQAKPTHFILKKQLQHTRDLRLAPTAQPACLVISPTRDSRQGSYRGHSTVHSVTRAGSSHIPELNDCRMAIGPRTFMVQINAQIVLLASGQAASKD